MDKTALRREIREKKRAMTAEEIRCRSEKLGELFVATQAYKEAKAIYGYLPYNQEVCTVPMLEHLETEEFDIPVDQVLWA